MNSRTEQIYASCKADADAKINKLLWMLRISDPAKPHHLAETALAAEDTAIAVRKLYQINLAGAENGMA